MLSKAELRKTYLEIRQRIDFKAEKSAEICRKLLTLDEYKNASAIAFYKALPSEVSLGSIINEAFLSGKTVLLPKTLPDFSLKFYRVKKDEKFVKSPFGVYEPQGNAENEANKIDFIILPGVCFDLKLNRIGFGKGCYDRALKNFACPSAAVCFDEQIIKNELIPSDKGDVKPNILVTERQIYRKDF